MKISKVNHTKSSVFPNANGQIEGALYQVPGKGTIKLDKRIGNLNSSAARLYNIFAPIEEGSKPREPRDNKDEASKIRKEQYKIKIENYERRKKYVGVENKINRSVNELLFEKTENGDKVLRSVTDILKGMSAGKGLLDDEKKFDVKEFVVIALRKKLRKDMEGAICFLENIGQKNISSEDAKKIEGFIKLVAKDYNKFIKNKDEIIRSIRNQNLVMQPDVKSEKSEQARFAVSVPRQDGKSPKTMNRKSAEKQALDQFLVDYASLEKDERMAQLRKLRRIIDTYFNAPVSCQTGQAVELPSAVDITDFNVWEKHEAGKNAEGTFVSLPKILSAESKVRDEVKRKIAEQELRDEIRKKNCRCYRYAMACIEKYGEYYFDNPDINRFWIHHIENAVERVLKHRVTGNEFKLNIAYLQEKIWKDALNFISIKYIALGKMIYHFGMDGLYSDKQEITLGLVSDAVKQGISSFDYEIIKARETLQREMAVYVAFAANNLSRATVKLPEDPKKSDILLWKQEEFEENLMCSREELLTAILQFFGGKSAWDDAKQIFDKTDSVSLLNDLKDIIYSLRNESFHFDSANKNNGDWNMDLIGKMFEQDVTACISLEKTRFYSNNLPMFYEDSDLRKVLDILYAKPAKRASQVPAFNSVIVRKELPNYISTVLKYKTPSMDTDSLSKWYSACYYLFKEIYYNDFLQSAKSKDLFMQAIKKLDRSTDDYRRAVEDFEKRCKEIKDYSLSEICQMLMTEYNYQNNQRRKMPAAKASLFDQEIFKHYKLLLLQTLNLAFGEYLKQKKEYQFISKPDANKTEIKAVKDFLPDWKSDMYQKLTDALKTDAELQKWYITGRFLNARSLNLLVGSMRSYIQFVQDVEKRAGANHVALCKNEDENVKRIENAIPVIEVCIKLSSQFSNCVEDYFKDKDEYAEYLSQYIDFAEYEIEGMAKSAALMSFCNDKEDERAVGIYMDGQNPIVNRNVIMAKLFGPDRILSKNVEKIKKADVLDYYKQLAGISSYTTKGTCQNAEEQKKVIDFQRLKNRVELRDLTEYSELMNELLGQLVNWSFLRERDLLYFQLGFHYSSLQNDSKKPEAYTAMTCGGIQINHAILRQIVGLYINGFGICVKSDASNDYEEQKSEKSAGAKISLFCKYTKQIFSEKSADDLYLAGLELFENVNEHDAVVDQRNAIDHFKYYIEKAGSILDLYSEVFDRFFTYDMKYQKNVLNMISNILLRHNVIANLKVGTGKKMVDRKNQKDRAAIIVEELSADQFTYKCADQILKIDAKSEDYLETIAKILYYPNTIPNSLRVRTRDDKVENTKIESTDDKSGKNRKKDTKPQPTIETAPLSYNPFANFKLPD